MIIDLFSGAGGFSLGAIQAGAQVAVCVDCDDDLTSSHRHNFKDIPFLKRDLAETAPATLLNEAGLRSKTITGIIGGPPCQGFSAIGRRDVDDPRNTLVARFFEFVRAIRPGFFIFENVPGLLSERFTRVVDAAVELIPDDYDVVGPIVLNARDFGVASNRARVVLLGVPTGKGSSLGRAIKRNMKAAPTVQEAFEGLPPLNEAVAGNGFGWRSLSIGDWDGMCTYARSLREAPPQRHAVAEFILTAHGERRVSGFQTTRHSAAVIKRFQAVEPGQFETISKYQRLRLDSPAPTLRAGTGRDRGCYQAARPIHPTEPRVIGVREAARLQGFPDWFVFHTTKWHSFRMIGNSVSPPMAKRLVGSCLRLL